jgi:hypothetical protein
MYCITLTSALDRSLAGTKATNLAKAFSMGMHVPPGFVVTSEGLRLFLSETGLLGRVSQYLKNQKIKEIGRMYQPYEELCLSVMGTLLPEALKAEITPLAINLLSAEPAGVAVRSSAVNEDSPHASFAGIYASFLGITNLDDLWEKIQRVWCSAWSPQAIQYAHRMGIALRPDQMAVLVQIMVPAESAGVIFTADPLTGNPHHFVLNAAFGLAQPLVEGRAPADRYMLTWDTGQILEKEIVIKPTALVSRCGTMTEILLPADQQKDPAVTDRLAGEIAAMALAADRAFDQRVDVEWAAAGSQLYLLQVRPIPSLPAFFPHQLSPEESEITWTLEDRVWYATIDSKEHLVAPLSYHRRALELWERRAQPDDIFPHRSGLERDFNGYRYATEWTWYGHGHDPASTEAWLDAHEEPLRKEWLSQLDRVHQANQQAAHLRTRARRAKELIPGLLEFIKQEEEMQVAVWHAAQWLVFNSENLLKALLDETMPGFAIGELLQGLPCHSSQRTTAAQELGRSIKEDFVRDAFATLPLSEVIPRLGKEHPGCQFLKDYTAFCWKFGVVPPSLPMPWAGWGQDPAQILFMIKSNALGQAQDAHAVMAACTEQRQAAENLVRQHLRHFSPQQVERFDKLLGWAQFWVPALDDRKWHVAMSINLANLLYRTGSLLTSEGLLEKPTDLLLLTPEDLALLAQTDDPASYIQLYHSRQHAYESNRRLSPPPWLGKPPVIDGSPAAPREKRTADTLLTVEGKRVYQGIGFAPGEVSGTLRKVPDLNDTAFLETLTGDDILVCPRDSENDWWRRDWLSLFMVVRGLITVQGAQLHHATQIARECGVPFVNLPADDYDSLPDKAHAELDGSAGTVTIFPVAVPSR